MVPAAFFMLKAHWHTAARCAQVFRAARIDYRSSRRLPSPGGVRPPPGGAAPVVAGALGRGPSAAAGARDRGVSKPGDEPRSAAEGRWDGMAGAGRWAAPRSPPPKL